MRAKEKYIHVDSLGLVLFAQSRRPKRLSITVRPHKGVRVAVPARVSFKQAGQYLLSNLSWVQKSLGHVRKIEKQHESVLNDLPEIDRTEARTVIVNKLNELSRRYGLDYNRVSIRNQRTRWGSCSSANNISLNVNLVRLEQELMEYVILHELVHTKVKNHGKRFWAALDKYVGNAKLLDKALSRHRLGMYMAVQ